MTSLGDVWESERHGVEPLFAQESIKDVSPDDLDAYALACLHCLTSRFCQFWSFVCNSSSVFDAIQDTIGSGLPCYRKARAH
jgi:hypothetical protein